MPEGWGILEVNVYDPDNEFPEDPHIQRLTRNNEINIRRVVEEVGAIINEREDEDLITE